jgi:hypothetical protein
MLVTSLGMMLKPSGYMKISVDFGCKYHQSKKHYVQ